MRSCFFQQEDDKIRVTYTCVDTKEVKTEVFDTVLFAVGRFTFSVITSFAMTMLTVGCWA